MKEDWSHLDEWRERGHAFLPDTEAGERRGLFSIPAHVQTERLQKKTHFIVIATDGEGTGWEHVSVHTRYVDGIDRKMRTPRWDEMCYIKGLFWHPSECVVQFHPKDVAYVNLHDHVLHLWRCTRVDFPEPPISFV